MERTLKHGKRCPCCDFYICFKSAARTRSPLQMCSLNPCACVFHLWLKWQQGGKSTIWRINASLLCKIVGSSFGYSLTDQCLQPHFNGNKPNDVFWLLLTLVSMNSFWNAVALYLCVSLELLFITPLRCLAWIFMNKGPWQILHKSPTYIGNCWRRRTCQHTGFFSSLCMKLINKVIKEECPSTVPSAF